MLAPGRRYNKVCFDCRRSCRCGKKCPECGQDLKPVHSGYRGHIPKRKDVAGWDRLRANYVMDQQSHRRRQIGYRRWRAIRNFINGDNFYDVDMSILQVPQCEVQHVGRKATHKPKRYSRAQARREFADELEIHSV